MGIDLREMLDSRKRQSQACDIAVECDNGIIDGTQSDSCCPDEHSSELCANQSRQDREDLGATEYAYILGYGSTVWNHLFWAKNSLTAEMTAETSSSSIA